MRSALQLGGVLKVSDRGLAATARTRCSSCWPSSFEPGESAGRHHRSSPSPAAALVRSTSSASTPSLADICRALAHAADACPSHALDRRVGARLRASPG